MDTATEIHLDFEAAYQRLKGVVKHTPLEYNEGLSAKYECKIYLKREDLQIVRSYKLRGAYNLIAQLSQEQIDKGVVCASAGNHAQGVAYSCKKKGIKGIIYMPEITPKQKVKQTEMFGNGNVELVLTGDTFDDCLREALIYTKEHDVEFIPPFDDYRTIEGQGTVGVEILQDLPQFDVAIMPIGGGGLAAGMGTYLRQQLPNIILIGVEPEGAPSMLTSITNGENTALTDIDRFVDGAAVKRVGDKTFAICREILDDMLTVPEGKVCTTILKLYNEDAIVVEPAGALSVTALDAVKDKIKGKTVVCVISGGNNDIDRMQEIKEKSLLYEGLKHYFIVRFPQRPGALKLFVNNVLAPGDDITRFEFIKKNSKENGPALVGIELKNAEDYPALLERMAEHRFEVIELNRDKTLFEYLV
ncbi:MULTISPECIES: threonine ammonia-lyase IlvA [unclassified Mucilaginibacter]|uniref:threonine ammonia-lyase IlvA n=1 Tax=unclassified Mucilaginibacter TaxID=2617802 RepID=UPI002AC93A18|nr:MULTISPECIES: threonine ammonia-lyase IlvA [unclassified Mucilaginibacter]MEB0263075.1 threonine ammonia-lyase IlvA [Mucilaginibacter sp. 10I4]MEB0277514.1 threonine ammonia-lyase IlvA [Mucilaginibacter sp. 10B2]MEB0299429.1 threonine ammonia-lyase IlvA [Mucilaginibacter sp. 5C4]WPX24856.1 threonine ammonia-lyase IlvA [Mucilaginibacter sp. 5C4]